MTLQTTDYFAPWNLDFDQDGTEDFGIIRDANGQMIAASHLPSTRIARQTYETGTFWLPEKGDAKPLLLRQLRLMIAAPTLLAAVLHVLEASEDGGDMNDIDWNFLQDAVAEAETRS